jgi:hypothetical protein
MVDFNDMVQDGRGDEALAAFDAARVVSKKPKQKRPPARDAVPEDIYVDNPRDAARKAEKMAGDRRPKFDWRQSSISAAALKKKKFPDIKWVVPGFLPEGVALLAAKPKIGKSWLALDWLLAVSCGGKMYCGYNGVDAKQGECLYLALEDNERRLQSRIDKLGLEWPDHLTLATEWPRSHESGIEALEDWIRSAKNPRLIVVDTLAKFRPPQSSKRPAYELDYEAITPLKKLADRYGVAILVITHLRKAAADEPHDNVSGTLGLTGAADASLIIERRSTGPVLCLRGRDIAEAEYAAKFVKDACRWQILGDAAEVEKSAERQAIKAALEDAFKEGKTDEECALTTKEIKGAAGIKKSVATLNTLLLRMAKAGEIEKAGRGRYRCAA